MQTKEPEAGSKLGHPPVGLGLGRRQEDLPDGLGEPRPQLLGCLPDDVPLEVDAAPLQRRLGDLILGALRVIARQAHAALTIRVSLRRCQ